MLDQDSSAGFRSCIQSFKAFNSLLTEVFLQKLMPVAGDFFLVGPKLIVISLTLCGLLYSIVTSDTPVQSFTHCNYTPVIFCETLSSVHISLEAEEHFPALSVSFSFFLTESITKVFLLI